MQNKKKNGDSNELLNELILKQIKKIPQDKKLQFTDLRRICKYINTSIFDENKCSIWSGYITNAGNCNKGTYINFYFRKKKAALHRLLYANFVDEINDNEYLKFSCENKGTCCNVKHLRKFKYQKKIPMDIIDNKEKKQNVKINKVIKILKKTDSNDDQFFLSFN